MALKRRAVATSALLILVAAIGLLSNLISADYVEKRVQNECAEDIDRVARLWRLPTAEIRWLPPSAIRTHEATTSEGKRVIHQVPPRETPPFCYVEVKQAAPFVLRVQYGWATAGSHMAFGQGGEQLVVSVFGLTRTLRDRAHWDF